MEVVVPFSTTDPKSRLSEALDTSERRAFARAMLADVVDAVRACGGDPCVLATAPIELEISGGCTDPDLSNVPVVVDDRPLTSAVNDVLRNGTSQDGITTVDTSPTAVIMADLALVTPEVLSRFLDTDGDVVIAPGRGGGTNALVVRHPEFRVDYHGASYLDHLRISDDIGASVSVFDSHRLASDVDTPTDLVEVIVHTDGRAADWLREAGFELDRSDGRVDVDRP